MGAAGKSCGLPNHRLAIRASQCGSADTWRGNVSETIPAAYSSAIAQLKTAQEQATRSRQQLAKIVGFIRRHSSRALRGESYRPNLRSPTLLRLLTSEVGTREKSHCSAAIPSGISDVP